MLGIPLYLITLADLAKFCTEGMNRSYTEILKFKFEVFRKLKKWKKYGLIKRRESIKVDEIIIAGGDDEVAEFLWTHLENAHFVEVPFLLIYVILLSYIGLASYVIAYLEGWTLIDGFYFIMISVLTIGFGDIVPRNPNFILINLLIILSGIVLTTTCIDIVGAYYIDQLHFFGRRLDEENPLEWLKEVQQKRIQAMKREAMRKLFETVTALHRMQFGGLKYDPSKLNNNTENDKSAPPIKLPDAPFSPKNLIVFNATSDSVCLKWEPPIFVDEGRRFWYTLTYKTRTPQFRSNVTIVDFITTENYKVTGLKSFTLYEFSVVTTTRYGSSKPIKCQEYTEPCTVPQLVNVDAVSSETATISWQAPQKNNGLESYVVLYAQEPAPQFVYWTRYKVGSAKKFTITDLRPDTVYIVCVSAEHNFGLAAMSKSIRFKTRRFWFEEELLVPFTSLLRISNSMHKLSSASSESNCLR
uniref:Fibronectin type-III domain-containing protein n=1 Tax=Acrobeloides nanus TaxID=290746 RepID=A0A914DT17_9BILA